MTDVDFDKAIREKLENCTEQPDAAMWQGIERKMVRSRRISVFKAVSVAAAACIAAVLFLVVGRYGDDMDVVSATDNDIISEILETEEIPPVQEQIVTFVADKKVIAEVLPEKYTKKASCSKKDIVEVVSEPQKSEFQTIGREEAETVTTDGSEESNYTENTVRSTYPTYLRIEEDRFDDSVQAVPTASRRRLASLSVSSNVAPGTSQSQFVYRPGPSYAAPLVGDNVLSGVEQISPAHFSVPLTFGLQVRFSLSNRWAIGTGLSYTYYQTGFDEVLVNNQKFKRASSQLHYIGIPVNAFYNIVDSKHFCFYAKAGGSVEKGIRSRFVYADKEVSGSIKGVQFSVTAGVGIEYRFLDNLGIYFDPSMVYYFKSKPEQPQSIRTEHPLFYGFELGLRFSL